MTLVTRPRHAGIHADDRRHAPLDHALSPVRRQILSDIRHAADGAFPRWVREAFAYRRDKRDTQELVKRPPAAITGSAPGGREEQWAINWQVAECSCRAHSDHSSTGSSGPVRPSGRQRLNR